MSHITDVILITSVDDEGPGVPRIQGWLASEGRKLLARVDAAAGGERVMQADVYAGAYNYLAAGEFERVFRLCDWEYPEEVMLLLKEEHDDWFEVHRDPRAL